MYSFNQTSYTNRHYPERRCRVSKEEQGWTTLQIKYRRQSCKKAGLEKNTQYVEKPVGKDKKKNKKDVKKVEIINCQNAVENSRKDRSTLYLAFRWSLGKAV